MPAHFDTGFMVREPAWHGLGNVIADYPQTWDEAAKLAGLDWEPIKHPMFDRQLVGMEESGEPRYEYTPDPHRVYLKRSDNNAVLSSVWQTYEPIPNATMGEILEAFLGQDKAIRINTMGSLYDGQKVWALAELGEPVWIGNDPSPTARYLALLNSHDGGSALAAIATNVRIVCANTWKGAEIDGDRHGHQFKFRHTKNWRAYLEAAKEAIAFGRKESDEIIAGLEELTKIRVTKRQREIFVQDFIPMPVGEIISDRVVSNVETARTALRGILTSQTCEGIDNTVYGLVQAAGEYLDHVRAYKTYSTYVNRTLLATEPLKNRAKKIALAVAGA